MTALRLTRPAAERLLAQAGAPAPWLPPASRLARLDAREQPDAEVAALRVPTREGLHPDLVRCLAAFAAPTVLVDVDLAVRRPGGHPRLHSWVRPTADLVASLSTTGTDVELAWHARTQWAAELARIPAAAEPAAAYRSSGGAPVDAPQRALVATGAAWRTGRHDLVDVLTSADPETRRLHECRARLRVVATGRSRVGWVGWVLLTDGWHELSRSGADVRLTPIAPDRLGARVEDLIGGVRA